MAKYRLLRGQHMQDVDGVETLFKKGDVFESTDTMVARDVNKFQLVDEASKVSPGELTGKGFKQKSEKTAAAPAPAPVSSPEGAEDKVKDKPKAAK